MARSLTSRFGPEGETGAMGWRERGRCLHLDPETFHPEDDEDEALDAKAICALCPVRELCLEHAITHREKHGVWGGLTARERRRLIRRRRRAS